MSVSLKEKTILITGGSKGIGYGIAASLLAEGAKVAVTSRSEKSARKAAEELSKSGNAEVMGIAADVRDAESQVRAVSEVVARWGKLDVLIANAGLGHFVPIENMTIDQWNETIDTNLSALPKNGIHLRSFWERLGQGDAIGRFILPHTDADHSGQRGRRTIPQDQIVFTTLRVDAEECIPDLFTQDFQKIVGWTRLQRDFLDLGRK